MACPGCGHVQEEPSLAVSTFCRTCGNHFEVDGPSKQAAAGRSARKKTKRSLSPVLPHRRRQRGNEAAFIQRTPRTASHPFSSPSNRGGNLDVICFNCDARHEVSPGATSAHCPSCGTYISLDDVDVRSERSGEILTQGDVVIHRHGVHLGTIFARNITIRGRILGRLHATGRLEFHHSGCAHGEIVCDEIFVARGIQLEFASPVTARIADIAGAVEGEFHCSERFRLRKKARFKGALRTANFDCQKGGDFDGAVDIIDNSRPGEV